MSRGSAVSSVGGAVRPDPPEPVAPGYSVREEEHLAAGSQQAGPGVESIVAGPSSGSDAAPRAARRAALHQTLPPLASQAVKYMLSPTTRVARMPAEPLCRAKPVNLRVPSRSRR